MIDYPMCPDCRRADVEVAMAKEVRGPCPHCGGVLVANLRVCCIPECKGILLGSQQLPVCKPCGIKIAMLYASQAALHDPLIRDRRREQAAHKERRRAELEANSVVYYVRLANNRIKIGYTGALKSRLAALRAHPSDLLAIEPGSRDVERTRHEQFRADRLTKKIEEFRPSPQLLEWIDALRAEHDLPSWAKVPDTRVTVRGA